MKHPISLGAGFTALCMSGLVPAIAAPSFNILPAQGAISASHYLQHSLIHKVDDTCYVDAFGTEWCCDPTTGICTPDVHRG